MEISNTAIAWTIGILISIFLLVLVIYEVTENNRKKKRRKARKVVVHRVVTPAPVVVKHPHPRRPRPVHKRPKLHPKSKHK